MIPTPRFSSLFQFSFLPASPFLHFLHFILIFLHSSLIPLLFSPLLSFLRFFVQFSVFHFQRGRIKCFGYKQETTIINYRLTSASVIHACMMSFKNHKHFISDTTSDETEQKETEEPASKLGKTSVSIPPIPATCKVNLPSSHLREITTNKNI